MTALLAALSWEPQVKGALYVLTAVLILVGSAYLLLSTNMGARLGFMLTAAGLFGFLTTIGIVWWVYGIGPKGPEPKWDTVGVITGDLSSSRLSALEGFPREWEELDPADKEVADAQPVVDSQVVGPRRPFQSSSEYILVGAYAKGGETFGPLGIDIRPFDVFHKPHYLMIQVQKTRPVQTLPGQPAPRPEPDPSAPVISVAMLRDLGARRLNPAVFTISSALLFGLVCYQLHVRDKQAWEKREQEAGRPQPVSR